MAQPVNNSFLTEHFLHVLHKKQLAETVKTDTEHSSVRLAACVLTFRKWIHEMLAQTNLFSADGRGDSPVIRLTGVGTDLK